MRCREVLVESMAAATRGGEKVAPKRTENASTPGFVCRFNGIYIDYSFYRAGFDRWVLQMPNIDVFVVFGRSRASTEDCAKRDFPFGGK